jgi:Magnesium chelatase, subunit ChlI
MLAKTTAFDPRPARHRSSIADRQDPLARKPPSEIRAHGWARKTRPYLRRLCSRLPVTPPAAPLRLATHQTISDAGLIDGEFVSRRGDVSLSQNGPEFPDELFEFPATFLKSSASPAKNRASPSPAAQCHSVASYAPPFRAGIRSLLISGEDTVLSSALKQQLFSFSGSRIKLC